MMWRCVFLLAFTFDSSTAILEGLGIPFATNRTRTIPDIGSLLGLPWLSSFFLGPPSCGGPETCPNYSCRQNPAVVHGYCCGCASPFDLISVPCPGNIQCPVYREPLCTDYRYMIDCCCSN